MKNFIHPALYFAFSAALAACNVPTSTPSPSSPVSSDFAVENVKVEKEFKNAWTLKGMVRNNSDHPASIAVTVKFLNAKGDVVHASKAVVNNWDPVNPGQAAVFEYATDPKDFDGVTEYDVEPYERP